MSTKVFALLAFVVLFASIVVSQTFSIDVGDTYRHRVGPPQQDIESFFVSLHDDQDTVLVLGENEKFVLTDVYCSGSSGDADLIIYRNSETQLYYRGGIKPSSPCSFNSGIVFHPGEVLVARHIVDGNNQIWVTLSGYFIYE